MRVTFLSPQLPPAVCGVGDHTVHLASAMREHCSGITALYVHGAADESGQAFQRVERWNRRPEALADLVREHGSGWLWVQYSPYGYGYQGLPWYLVHALRRLRGRVKIALYFHEAHCGLAQLGWKGYVLSPLQRRIGQKLARCADVLFTSCELYCDLIRRDYRVPDEKLFKLPIGSNIHVPILTANKRQQLRQSLGWAPTETVAITFGSAGSQRSALRRNHPTLIEAIHKKQIHRMICIGGVTDMPAAALLDACDNSLRPHTTVMGHQDDHRVAQMLVAADVALTGYPVERFGKSSAIMAYAMAGLPVLRSDEDENLQCADTREFLRIVHAHQLPEIACDERARLDQQERAMASISWPVLGRRAFMVLDGSLPQAGLREACLSKAASQAG